jgi:two-component system, response regulator YesN
MYNVLIADDEQAICKGLSVIIDWESYGYNPPNTAEDGEDALEKLNVGKYNLVITDIRMPVIDGLELIRAIRVQNPFIKILIISGYSDFEYAKQAMENDVKGYMLKPINRNELTRYISNIKSELDAENISTRLCKLPADVLRDKLLSDLIDGRISSTKLQEWMENIGLLQEHKSQKIIFEIKEYIDKHYQESINLKSIANVFYLNSSYLGRLFTNTFGIAFNDYLNKMRIAGVKEMVLQEGKSIHETIIKVGYNNHEHFYRQFKRYEGISFLEFREKVKIYRF